MNLEQSMSRIWELISHGNIPSDKHFAFVDSYSQVSSLIDANQEPNIVHHKDFGYKSLTLTSWSPSLDALKRAVAQIVEPNVPICDILYLDSLSPLLRRYSPELVCSLIRDMKTSFVAHGKEGSLFPALLRALTLRI